MFEMGIFEIVVFILIAGLLFIISWLWNHAIMLKEKVDKLEAEKYNLQIHLQRKRNKK